MFTMTKREPYRNANHLAWVRSKPCISCGCDFGIDAHHIIGVGISGTMGGKEDDSLTIPLCRICHQKCHESPREFDQLYYFTRFMKSAFNNNEITLTK